MEIRIQIGYTVTEQILYQVAEDYLDQVMDKCQGDETKYRTCYNDIVNGYISDICDYVKSYQFEIGCGKSFYGVDINSCDLYNLIDTLRYIILEEMEIDLYIIF